MRPYLVSMGLRRRVAPPRNDVVLTLALMAASQVEVLTYGAAGGGPLGAVGLLLVTGVALWWRTLPVMVALLTTGFTVVTAFATRAPPGSLSGYVVTALSFGAIGALCSRLTSVLLLSAAAAWGFFMMEEPSLNLYLAIVMTSYVVPWTVGLLWLRSRETRRLEEERAEAEARAVARERRRLAQELHDVVTHHVGMMVVQAGAGDVLLDKDPAAARSSLNAIEVGGRQTLLELRRLLGLLREDEEAGLLPQPTLSSLPELVDSLKGSGLEVSLCREGEARGVDAGVELTAYRIVQEGLTNVVKHARARRVDVLVRVAPEKLEIEVRDDGAGHEPLEQASGFGLRGLTERVAVFGGELTATPLAHGFVLRAELPLAHL